MVSEFIHCPKCGVRNFKGDKHCGICNEKLPDDNPESSYVFDDNVKKNRLDATSPLQDNAKIGSASSNGKGQVINIIFVSLLIAGVGYFVLKPRDSIVKPRKDSSRYDILPEAPTYSRTDQVKISESKANPPELQLSIIGNHEKGTAINSLALFRQLLLSLEHEYPECSKQHIANALVSSHNILVKEGFTISLLEFATEFNSFSKNVDGSFDMNIEQALALYLKTVYF